MSTPSTTTPPPSTTTTVRPWLHDFLSISSFSLPLSIPDLSHRIQTNLHTFHTNYLFISFLIFLLTLIPHPLTFLLFLAIFLPSIHLVVNHHEPLTVFGFELGQRLVAIVLFILTIVALTFTHMWWNVFLSVLISIGIVFVHASFRTPDDAEESPYGALLSVIDEDENARGPYTLV